MAIQTTKLSEVEVTQSAVDPKLLVEDEGEIKRIPPEVIAPSQVPVYYYPADGALWEEATSTLASKTTLVDQWNTGARIRIRTGLNATTCGDVIGVSYSLASEAISGDVTLSYVQGGSTTISTVSVTEP